MFSLVKAWSCERWRGREVKKEETGSGTVMKMYK
jgi:hypothetical protein